MWYCGLPSKYTTVSSPNNVSRYVLQRAFESFKLITNSNEKLQFSNGFQKKHKALASFIKHIDNETHCSSLALQYAATLIQNFASHMTLCALENFRMSASVVFHCFSGMEWKLKAFESRNTNHTHDPLRSFGFKGHVTCQLQIGQGQNNTQRWELSKESSFFRSPFENGIFFSGIQKKLRSRLSKKGQKCGKLFWQLSPQDVWVLDIRNMGDDREKIRLEISMPFIDRSWRW